MYLRLIHVLNKSFYGLLPFWLHKWNMYSWFVWKNGWLSVYTHTHTREGEQSNLWNNRSTLLIHFCCELYYTKDVSIHGRHWSRNLLICWFLNLRSQVSQLFLFGSGDMFNLPVSDYSVHAAWAVLFTLPSLKIFLFLCKRIFLRQ